MKRKRLTKKQRLDELNRVVEEVHRHGGVLEKHVPQELVDKVNKKLRPRQIRKLDPHLFKKPDYLRLHRPFDV